MLKQKLATVKLERSKVKAQLENVDSPASEKTKVQALWAKIVDNKGLQGTVKEGMEEVEAKNMKLEDCLTVKRQNKLCNSNGRSSSSKCSIDESI